MVEQEETESVTGESAAWICARLPGKKQFFHSVKKICARHNKNSSTAVSLLSKLIREKWSKCLSPRARQEFVFLKIKSAMKDRDRQRQIFRQTRRPPSIRIRTRAL
jgi:hypothetical protein